MSFAMVAMGVVGAVKLGMSLHGKKERAEEQKKAKAAMEAKRAQYEALDTSNTFKNMENKMEDLTINQKAMEVQSQQAAQSRANTMQALQGAAGGSGIAALAQAMANQGQLAAQKSAAMIGEQEAANQKAAAGEASKIDQLERQGEQVSQQRTMDKTSTLLAMDQARLAAANQAEAEAKKQQMDAVGTIGSAVGGGLSGGSFTGMFGAGGGQQ